jgi:hypothetical protein
LLTNEGYPLLVHVFFKATSLSVKACNYRFHHPENSEKRRIAKHDASYYLIWESLEVQVSRKGLPGLGRAILSARKASSRGTVVVVDSPPLLDPLEVLSSSSSVLGCKG